MHCTHEKRWKPRFYSHHTCTHVHMQADHICMHSYPYVDTHIWLCLHTCIHTHMHTQAGKSVKWWVCYILIVLIISLCVRISQPQTADLKFNFTTIILEAKRTPHKFHRVKKHCKWFWNLELYFSHFPLHILTDEESNPHLIFYTS